MKTRNSVATIPKAQAVWCASPSLAGQESYELLLIMEILARRKGTNTRGEALVGVV